MPRLHHRLHRSLRETALQICWVWRFRFQLPWIFELSFRSSSWYHLPQGSLFHFPSLQHLCKFPLSFFGPKTSPFQESSDSCLLQKCLWRTFDPGSKPQNQRSSFPQRQKHWTSFEFWSKEWKTSSWFRRERTHWVEILWYTDLAFWFKQWCPIFGI